MRPGNKPCRFYRSRITGMDVKHKKAMKPAQNGETWRAGDAAFCGRSIPTALPKLLLTAFRYARTVAYTERREGTNSQTEMSG